MNVAVEGASDIDRFRRYVGEGCEIAPIDIDITLGPDDRSWMFVDFAAGKKSRNRSGGPYLPEPTIRSQISRLRKRN